MKLGTFIKIIVDEEEGWLNIDQIMAFGEKDGEFKIIVGDGDELKVDEKTYYRMTGLFNLIDLTKDDFLSETEVKI